MVRKRRILLVTGARADYGLQKTLIKKIEEHPRLDLLLVVTGSHLSPMHGMTINEIIEDGVYITENVDLEISGDTPSDICAAIATGLQKFSLLLPRLKPDIVVLVGDRYELLCPAISSMISNIPIAHIAGGHVTEGAIDDAIRHSLTKYSHIHFTATRTYADRIVQLGEDPDKVFVVGSTGLDRIIGFRQPSKREFEDETGISIDRPSLLVTLHPASLDDVGPETQINELLAAIEMRPDFRIIFTLPNSDPGSEVISQRISQFVSQNKHRSTVHSSLGGRMYLAALSLVDGVVGNSSSGIIEAPSFGVGTVNIGKRQQGRIFSESVISCSGAREEIVRAIDLVTSPDFRDKINARVNPYGDGRASGRIVAHLENLNLKNLTLKRFFDL